MSQRSDVAAFIARLQADPENQIGYVGNDAAQIDHALSELEPPFEEGFVVEKRDDVIAAAMGAEYDLKLKRAWIFGPFVDAADWDATADRLYAWIEALLPIRIDMHELFFNRANLRTQRFGERHGFSRYKDVKIMEFRRERLGELPPGTPEFLAPDHEDAFVALHDRVFPNTYYTGSQLLERRNDERQILTATDTGELLGYTYVEVEPRFGEGSIDFVGVAESARGRGIATGMVQDALRWMFSFETMDLVELNVDVGNEGAERIYSRAGFRHSLDMRSMRKEL